MADIFIEAQRFNEKTLPVLEAIASQKRGDERFLDGLCRSYAIARQTGGKVKQACEDLLKLKPESLVALRLLAKCEFQMANTKGAAEHAEAACRLAPEDKETLDLL